MASADTTSSLFKLDGNIAVVTGGAGVLGSGVCHGLSNLGVKIAILDRPGDALQKAADSINSYGGKAIGVASDVLDKKALNEASDTIRKHYGKIDFLLNFAGGNQPQATVSNELSFFDLPADAFDKVVRLNLHGTVLPCQVFGKVMADQKSGTILNVSSMAALRPLTRVVGYGAAKAAMTNFTYWLAVHMAKEYSTNIRVNAIAPGFLVGNQNRALLLDEKTGQLTKRGQTIIDHTPMGRFGTPEDLLGTIIWLLSPAAAFVTGVVVPIDGGFAAFGGV
jgi:NAD(P)-dependent dehydrogenase (short-subunit alcohol dehydrogenase family)